MKKTPYKFSKPSYLKDAKRPEKTNFFCDKCGHRLNDFELLQGCFNCARPVASMGYIHPTELEKAMKIAGLLTTVAYEMNTSLAVVRQHCAINVKSPIMDKVFETYRKVLEIRGLKAWKS